jgi:hypothetical protein
MMTVNAARVVESRAFGPPEWGFLGGVTLATLISFYLTSVPYPYSEGDVFMLFAWSLLGIMWIVWLIRLVVAVSTGRRRPAAHWWVTAIRWLLFPLMVAGVFLAVRADVPFWVRFTVSQSSLEQYAVNLANGGREEECRWAGLYYACEEPFFEETRGAPSGVQLMVTDWPLMRTRGFVWMPAGRPPPDDGWTSHKHLVGPWWGRKTWDGW